MSVASVAFPLFAVGLGFRPSIIGILYALDGAVGLITYIPFGALSDRIGRKWQMVAGHLIAGALWPLYPLTSSFAGFAVLRIADGFGDSVGSGPKDAYIMDWTVPAERGKATGIRSFFDSTGNGIGDINGVIQKLDYLEDLGVNCISLLPFYQSPLKDDGYDISSFKKIHSDFGTMKQFRQ